MNLLGIENDIIQIGVCLLNVNTGEITNNTGVFVKPEGSVLSFFTVLTTITPKMI
jgi:DNA polymerase III alpha subunit (gram-positive type)